MTAGTHRLRLTVKEKPSCVVRKVIHLREAGVYLGSPFEVINPARGEMLCKTIIGFSSELVRVPNVATANETGNEGFAFEAQASAKQA